MADELYVPQMDYTSREFTAIRNDLIGLIPNFAPQWTSRDASDFGIVLLELFSYMGDLANYQADRAANEAFLDTATQRDTVIKLANLLGYIPSTGSAATGSVTFTNSSTSPVTVTAGTQISTQGDSINPAILFTLDSDVAVGATSTAAGNVTQGQKVVDEIVGTSDGTANQVFSLVNAGVFIDSNFSVKSGYSFIYTRVNNIIDADATDYAYVAYTDGAGVTHIKFGDGVSGKIPPSTTTIRVSYRYTTTAPSLGNVAKGTLTTINGTSGVTVTNSTKLSGGADAESTDSIRTNAPKALSTLNRAVSLQDYANLALSVNGVAKAIALATSFSSVALYLAGSGGGVASTSLKSSVTKMFNNKTAPGTTVTLKDFTPVYPYLTVTVQVLPQYSSSDVVNNVQAALENLFKFDNVTFNDFISEGEIYSTCKAVDGVSFITITDYEKLAAVPTAVGSSSTIYTQTGKVSPAITATTATSIPVVLAAGTAGIFKGSKIASVTTGGVVSTTHASVGLSVSTVSSDGLTVTLSNPLGLSIAFSNNDIITVTGNNGIVPGSRDLSCAINEIPIYEPTYITVTANGGS